MAIYADTSLLAAYYCPEHGSDLAQTYLTSLKSIAISWVTETEVFSALSRKVREREMSRGDAQLVVKVFQEHIEAGSYEVLLIGASDYRDANRLIGRFETGLRALDALHVAVSLRENKTLATADIKLAKAAEHLGGKVDFVDYAMASRSG